jgi:hypothetical protein
MVKRGRPTIVFPPEALALFGKVPDAVIAGMVGCHTMTVAARRRSMNIPSFTKGPEPYVSPLRKEDPLLGVVSDTDLARARGVSRQAITARRTARGIKAGGDGVVLGSLLLEVHDKGEVLGDGRVSIPADLYERIGDLLGG